MLSPSVYQPIQGDLLQVEENLRALSKVNLPLLAELLNHILENSGKRIRPALALFAAKFHHYNLERLIPMATAVELLHTATLVHDDTIDNSSTRRGKPTVHNLWSRSSAVLVGDYLFANAAQLASATDNMRVIKLFAQTIMTICAGEIEEVSAAFDWRQTPDRYWERITTKTASLFSAATESGALLSEAPEESVEALKSYGLNLGMAFQIVDDVLDFMGSEEEVGKPVGSDLLQGTLTLPSILLIERYPKDNPIKKIFQNRKDNLRLAVEMIRNSSIIEDCYTFARTYSLNACQALDILPHNRYHSSLMELAEYVVERKR